MAASVNIWQVNGTNPTGWQGGNPKFGDLARTSNGNVWMNIGDNKQLSGWQLIGTQNQVDFDAGLEVSEEGSPVVTKALKMNFVGASVTATGSGDTATVNVTGGGGGGPFLIEKIYGPSDYATWGDVGGLSEVLPPLSANQAYNIVGMLPISRSICTELDGNGNRIGFYLGNDNDGVNPAIGLALDNDLLTNISGNFPAAANGSVMLNGNFSNLENAVGKGIYIGANSDNGSPTGDYYITVRFYYDIITVNQTT